MLTLAVAAYLLGALATCATIVFLLVEGCHLTMLAASPTRWVLAFTLMMLIWPVMLPTVVDTYRTRVVRREGDARW